MNKVTRYTRCPRKKITGKVIICPKCTAENTVYHFAWIAITCQTCKKMVNKYDFFTKLNKSI